MASLERPIVVADAGLDLLADFPAFTPPSKHLGGPRSVVAACRERTRRSASLQFVAATPR